MKRINFLRSIVATLAMALMIIGLVSCTPPPYCEKNHTGDVTIYNSCGYRITVDVNSPDISGDGFAGERNISSGGSVTYQNIPAGPIDIWEADLYSDWGYWEEYLNECEDFEFEVYEGKGATTIYISSGAIETKIKGEKNE